jgi:glycosyltransferase involved in cell wall biosynthesis
VGGLIEVFRERGGEDLVIAGNGSEEESLRDRARELPWVRFVGWVDRERLDRLYRGALGVVLPTAGHESFPLVLLEGFSRGVPAVARRFSAQGELIERSGGGLAYGSAAELTQALNRLAANPGLRDRLGRSGRTAYERHWTPDAHLSGYLSLISELAGARA